MKRTSYPATLNQKQQFKQLASAVVSRQLLAQRMGFQYGGNRNIYAALGYPEEHELTYEWFYNRWARQDVASAVIDRPVDECWNSFIGVSDNNDVDGSLLRREWNALNKRVKLNRHLISLDKTMGLGHYAVLLLGFSDVKKPNDWGRPVTKSRGLKLNFVRAVSEEDARISEFEQDSSNERFGQPKFYSVSIGNRTGRVAIDQTAEQISLSAKVHHSRVIHVAHGGLDVNVYGMPRLKRIANRLVDLDKLIGGDAEMFWRGARPGYTASPQDDFTMDSAQIDDLIDQLQEFENDLRRFITTEGYNIDALEQQFADPANHVDIQFQAISAQTGIPKRILMGSERGELASSQDLGQWTKLIKSKAEDQVEPIIINPLVDKLMSYGVLPPVTEYVTLWEDWFAPSKAERAKIGGDRAKAWKDYSQSNTDQLPPRAAKKYILGLDEDEIDDVEAEVEEQAEEEDNDFTPQNGNTIEEELVDMLYYPEDGGEVAENLFKLSGSDLTKRVNENGVNGHKKRFKRTD